MAARVILESNDVWEYFTEHKEELFNSMKMIAENQEYGIEIYLTENDGLPVVMVSVDGEEIAEEAAVSTNDCAYTVKEIYDKYLSKNVISILMGEEEEYTIAEELEIIDDREAELDNAVYECLMAFAPDLLDIVEDPDETCEDLKDHLCEYLYKKHDISVYRPMYLENDEGTDEFFEYPYPEMELDEE